MKLESLPLDDRALIDAFEDNVFTVGGRTRDHLLSLRDRHRIAQKDADYVVVGHTLKSAAEQLRRLGRIDTVGQRFAAIKLTRPGGDILDIALARREKSTGAGHRDFDIHFGPEVTIENDLERRDYTVGAIAVRLADRRIFALPSSLADLEAGILRMTSDAAFPEDPLRMLRGIQFASRFGFAFDGATAAAIRAHHALLATIESERIGEEIVKLIERSPHPAIGIGLLRDFGLLADTLPELAEGIGVEQNRFHIFDVFGHNLRALDLAAEFGGDLTDRLAALFHDTGKPRTIGDRADGGHSFHGHETVSAQIVRRRLPALHFPSSLVDDVAELSAAHMYAIDAGRNALGQPIAFNEAYLRRFIQRIARGTDDRSLARERLTRQFALRHADRHAGNPARIETEREAPLRVERIRRIRAHGRPHGAPTRHQGHRRHRRRDRHRHQTEELPRRQPRKPNPQGPAGSRHR